MRLGPLSRHPRLIEEIARLKFREFSYLVPGKTQEDFARDLHEHCRSEGLPITYVALEKGEFFGTISLRIKELDSHAHLSPWVGSVLVHPEKRNKGVGTFLIEEAETIAFKMRYRTLYLFTPNKASWYRKLGWTHHELTCFNGVPIEIMSKHLISSS